MRKDKKSYTKFADTSHYLFNMTIKEYIEIVSRRLQSGISREHSYRGDLEEYVRRNRQRAKYKPLIDHYNLYN